MSLRQKSLFTAETAEYAEQYLLGIEGRRAGLRSRMKSDVPLPPVRAGEARTPGLAPPVEMPRALSGGPGRRRGTSSRRGERAPSANTPLSVGRIWGFLEGVFAGNLKVEHLLHEGVDKIGKWV